MPTSVANSVVAFLKDIPPFQFLPREELAKLTASISLEYFPKNTVILRAGEKSSEAMYVVHKGAVKLTIPNEVEEDIALDVRSEGEIFGVLSMAGGGRARLDVTAIDDTLCYTIPAEEVQKLIAAHPDFAGYLLRTSVTRYIDRSLEEIRSQSRLLGEGERMLYSVSAAEAATKQATTCSPTATVQEAARAMAAAGASSILVVEDASAIGIITEADFAEKVVAQGLPSTSPVTAIMSSPVITVEGSERLFQVLVQMLSRDIHHVVVTGGGKPLSIVTYHDLMLLQSKSPLSIAREIQRQVTVGGIAVAQQRTNQVIALLVREGARADHITRVVAEISDRVLARILACAHEELGPSPVPYCWVTFGSEGRREQTFKTDQDNAIIYADVDDENRAAAEQYFAKLALFTSEALARCGYPPCPGGFVATNATWRQPLSVWKKYFEAWIIDATVRNTQNILILFDMRAVAGSFNLYQELAQHNQALLAKADFLKSIMAFLSVQQRPPLGFFRSFVVERGGEHRDELDLKMNGTGSIVNAARVFAIQHGVEATNSFDRLLALEKLGVDSDNIFRELREALEFLMMLRLERQLKQMESEQPLSNYLSPNSLSQLQRSLLKEAFRTIERAQSLIEARYRTAVWQQLS